MPVANDDEGRDRDLRQALDDLGMGLRQHAAGRIAEALEVLPLQMRFRAGGERRQAALQEVVAGLRCSLLD